MAKINYDFKDLRSKKFDLAIRIKKLEELIETIKNDGAISISILQELSELGFTEERALIESKTIHDIVSLLQPRLEELYKHEEHLHNEMKKYKKNLQISENEEDITCGLKDNVLS